MILCVISFAKLAAQENFASPIVIGQIHPLMPHYTNSQNSCLFADDIANASGDVVYQFSVAETYSVTMSMCGASYDSYIWLYDSGFNQIGGDDDACGGPGASLLTQTVTPGTYYIVCEGYSTNCGNYTLDVYANPINAGTFNACELVHYTDSKNTCGYANEVAGLSNDVIYSFVLGATQEVTMSLCTGTSYDSYIYLYDAAYSLIGENDDACSGNSSSLTQTLIAGTYYLVVEGYGSNCGTYTLDLFVEDAEAPVPALGVLPDINGPCSVNPVSPTAIDLCDGVIIGVTSEPIPFVQTGIVTWSYTDLHGNVSTQTQNVIIDDAEAPVITSCATDVTVNADPSDCDVDLVNTIQYDIPFSQIFGMTNGALCFGSEAYVFSGTFGFTWNSVAPNTPYQINVEFYQSMNNNMPMSMTYNGIADANYPGNMDWCIQNLYSGNLSPANHNLGGINTVQMSVADYFAWIENPAWTPGSFIRVTEIYDSNLLGAPVATDNCNIVSITNDAAASYPVGVYNINWTVTDGGGNTNNCVQILTVEDITAPVLDVPVLSDVTDECAVLSIVPPTATDNCLGVINGIPDVVFPITIQGTTVITWTYDDGNGNITTQTQNVVLTDVTAPVADIPVLTDVTDECAVLSIVPPTATDNCLGVINGTPNVAFPITAQGITVITWTYDDGNGNTSTQTQNVVINDITAPVMTCQSDISIDSDPGVCGAIVNYALPVVTDNCSFPNLIINGDASNGLNNWNVISNGGNGWNAGGGAFVTSYDWDTKYQVVDLLAAGYDASVLDLSPEIYASDDYVSGAFAGDPYYLTIELRDASNVAIASYSTGVISSTSTWQTASTTFSGYPAGVRYVYFEHGGHDVEWWAGWYGAIMTNATVKVLGPKNQTTGLASNTLFPVGTTTNTFVSVDAMGNSSSCSFDVVITDNEAPVPDIPVLADYNEQCVVWGLADPIVTDNCGIVTITNDAIFPISTQGTTVVTWTYDDGNGNFTTQTQNVVIEDNTGPTPDLMWLDDVIAQCEVTSLDQPWATDNCGGPVTVTRDVILPIEDQGTTVVTWTYEDMYGNITTQTQNVIIDDNQAPIPDINGFQILIIADNNVSDDFSWNLVDASSTVVASGGPYMNGHNGEILQMVSNLDAENGPYTFNGWGLGNFYDNDWSFEIYCNTNLVASESYSDSETASYSGIVGCQTNLDVLTDACSIVSLTSPTATDNCDGTVTVTHDAVLPIVGTSTITWSYEDENGNISTQTQEVIINDIIAPVPDVLVMDDITDECSVTELIAPTGTDNCGGPVTVSHDAILPITSQGTTVVTWTFADANMNTTTLTQNVIINDITDPVIVCADELVLTTDPGLCSAVLNPTNTIIYDIPLSQLVGMVGAGGCTVLDAYFCGGGGGPSWVSTSSETPVSVTVQFYQIYNDAGVSLPVQFNGLPDNDYNGGVTYCSPELVTLNLNPANYIVGALNTVIVSSANCFVLAQNPDPTWAAGSFARVIEVYQTDLEPTVTDNCGFTTLTNDMQPSYSVGTHTLTWTATDNNGNSASCEQTITVVDASGPIPDLAVLPDVTAECEILSLTEPTATDNCGGLVTVTNDATLPYDADGLYVVTWTYTDESDNVTTQTQNVIVDDYTYPVPDLPALVDLNGDCFVDPVIPTAIDNCSGVINGVPNYPMPFTGTYVVTWSFDDGNGNITTQLQNVTINDVTPPVPDMLTLADLTSECSVDPEPPTATDDCSGVVVAYTMATLPIIAQGTTVVTWIFEDNNGNISTQDQNVFIQDVTNPEIEAPEDLLMSTDPYACEMLTPLDTAIYYIYSPQLIGMSSPTGLACSYGTDYAVCGSSFGLTWLSNETIDPAFVTLEIYQIYNQNSVILPVSFNGMPDSDYIAPNGYCSTDLVTLDLSADSYIHGGINTVSINSYADCIVINQNPDTEWESGAYARVIVAYSSFDEPVATDNCELVSLVSDVQASYPIGNHTITWTATDIAGNITTVEQNLVVADLAGPIADEAVLADVTSDCEITTLTEPTALDYCTGPVTGVADVTLPLVETTTIHWTYTDANGNISIQEQNAIIEDNLAPVPDIAELDDVVSSCEVTTLDPQTATDNCSGSISGVHDADLPITEQGGTVVTWTYTDANGNVSTQYQIVIIIDHTAPVADIAELSEIFACADVATLTAPTATDECSGSIVGEHNVTLPITESTLVTWSYTDNIGNVTYQDQQITITNVDETVNDNSPYLTSNQDGATYQWLDCDNSYAPIDGATSQTFFATVNGNYAVEVTLNGCTEISDCYNVTNVGIGNDVSLTNNVEVYPNPTRGTITIEMPVEGETSWRLLDVTGQIVVEGNSTEQLFNLDLEDYTPGVYMLNLIQGDINTNMRVVRK